MSRKTGLAKNTLIFAIGNFSTKLLTFFLVPLYSFYLTPADFGEIGIYLTLLSMLYIVVSLQSVESTFRFIQECKTNDQMTSVITNALFTAVFGIGVFGIVMLVYTYVAEFDYGLIFFLHVLTNILVNFAMQTIRGMNKTAMYAVVGIISTVIGIACNIVFIVMLSMGAVSLLYAPIIANGIVAIIAFFASGIFRLVKLKSIDFKVIREQLKFSFPLIPNAICVWLMSAIGRFILLFYYTNAEVGILEMTLKFPALLTTINSIFFMAWQISMISTFNSDDKDKFASDIFNVYSKMLLSAVAVLFPIIKLIMFTIMGSNYIVSWSYIPFFMYGVLFQSFSSFYNIGFYSAKKTGTIFISSLASSSIYFALGIFLVKSLGIYGIGIAFLISEIIRFLIVSMRVRKYMLINVNFKNMIGLFTMVILSSVAYYLFNGIIYYVFAILIFTAMALAFNRDFINTIMHKVWRKQ